MEGHSMKLEHVLKSNNEDVLESVSICSLAQHSNTYSTHSNPAHPIFAKLRISPIDITTLEDFSDNI